jgi:putative spermidine/putrescine transport system permease protein
MAEERVSAAEHVSSAPYLLLAPAAVLFLALLASTILIARLSFGLKNQEWEVWSLANYEALASELYLSSLLRTVRLALIATASVMIMAIPVALFYARLQSKLAKRLLLFTILMPLFLNQLLQSYGWIIIFGPTGILNNFLLAHTLIQRPLRLLYSEVGVVIAMTQMGLPLAVLPIFSALRNIPASVEEAASVLGATWLRTLWLVTLPMSKPGLLAGALLVFSFNISAFVIPLLLGGGRVSTVPILVRQEMGPLLNWPQGAALALVLVTCALLMQTAPAAWRFLRRQS